MAQHAEDMPELKLKAQEDDTVNLRVYSHSRDLKFIHLLGL